MPATSWNSKKRYVAKQFLEEEKRQKWSSDQPLHEAFEGMTDIRAMRRRYTHEFLQVFIMGYRNYFEGEWVVAQTLLNRSNELLDLRDGPSKALLRFMEARVRLRIRPRCLL